MVGVPTYHILTTQNCALQNPSHLVARHSCIEWVKRNDISARAVKRLSVDLEVPLITRSDTALLNFGLGIRRLYKCDCTESALCDETDRVAVVEVKCGSDVV